MTVDESFYPEELLSSMGRGEVQSDLAIQAFVRGVVTGEVTRCQAAAWLAWAYERGLNESETLALTRTMTESGEIMTWEDGPVLVDKHSTGGVGDKVSPILAPLWAELGLRVPMISGRGLGHTGGTLDKLESIPGYQCALPTEDLRRILKNVGCFIAGQTEDLAPADRVLYPLRNETCTVDSIPLIVGSILSKKLAAGVERLVLDVKCGSGGFMSTFEMASQLAERLVGVAKGYGASCRAVITAMDRPLGLTVGNALEVEEAVACLQGGGPADLRQLVLELADHPGAANALDTGAAFERFCQMVDAQGGDASALHDVKGLLGGGGSTHTVEAVKTGYVQTLTAHSIGRAAFVLGGGRRHAGGAIDPGVGIRLHTRVGEQVQQGQRLAQIYYRSVSGLEEAKSLLAQAISVGEEPVESSPLIQGTVGSFN